MKKIKVTRDMLDVINDGGFALIPIGGGDVYLPIDSWSLANAEYTKKTIDKVVAAVSKIIVEPKTIVDKIRNVFYETEAKFFLKLYKYCHINDDTREAIKGYRADYNIAI